MASTSGGVAVGTGVISSTNGGVGVITCTGGGVGVVEGVEG